MPTGSRFRFGDFMLELGTRELTERETVRHLSPKAFDLLSLLVESCPKVISKKTLIEYLWPDTFVAEVNLASLVAELRRTLHDDAARPSFIRTVHRHGYAFCGKVQQDISSIARDSVAGFADDFTPTRQDCCERSRSRPRGLGQQERHLCSWREGSNTRPPQGRRRNPSRFRAPGLSPQLRSKNNHRRRGVTRGPMKLTRAMCVVRDESAHVRSTTGAPPGE